MLDDRRALLPMYGGSRTVHSQTSRILTSPFYHRAQPSRNHPCPSVYSEFRGVSVSLPCCHPAAAATLHMVFAVQSSDNRLRLPTILRLSMAHLDSDAHCKACPAARHGMFREHARRFWQETPRFPEMLFITSLKACFVAVG